MRIAEPPSLDSPWRGSPGDDLDGLLRSYFQSEMPEPWPALELPTEETILPLPSKTRSPRWKSFRSRLALAASVAFLLAGAWLIGGSLKPNAQPDKPAATNQNDSADRKADFDETLEVGPDGQLRVKLKSR